MIADIQVILVKENNCLLNEDKTNDPIFYIFLFFF